MSNSRVPIHTSARSSLAGVLLTSLLTTVHHYYRMGWLTLLLGLVTIGLPLAFLAWFRHNQSRMALAGYAVVSVWIIVGFGLVDGLWKSTLKLFLGHSLLASYGEYFSWAPVGDFPFEATGILASLSSLFAAYQTLRFLGAARAELRRRGQWLPPAASAAAAAVAVSALVFVAYQSTSRAALSTPGEVIKIGVIVPTHGPGALLGSSFLQAVRLAEDDLKDTRFRYELVIADTGTNAVQTRSAIQKLIGVDGVQAIVGGISLSGQVIQPYASYAHIPHLCVCSVGSIGDGEYNFTNIPLPEDEAQRWVEEARRRGIQRVALITQDYPSIDGHVAALKRELAARGLRVSYAQRFAAGQTDFAAAVAEARVSAPDVYFAEAAEPSLDALGRALRQAGIHDISSIVALSLSDHPELFEGAWYTDSDLADSGFRTRFERKYPGTRFATHMMPYAYDSLNLVVQGFESGRGVAQYLRETRAFEGTPGRVTKELGSGNFRSRPAVWVIKNGRPELYRAVVERRARSEE